jgi:pilus assembly protein Flp/PilA
MFVATLKAQQYSRKIEDNSASDEPFLQPKASISMRFCVYEVGAPPRTEGLAERNIINSDTLLGRDHHRLPHIEGSETCLVHHAPKWFTNLLSSEDGPTAVEYAVSLAIFVVVTLTSVTFLGKKSRRNFRQVRNALK